MVYVVHPLQVKKLQMVSNILRVSGCILAFGIVMLGQGFGKQYLMLSIAHLMVSSTQLQWSFGDKIFPWAC